MKDGNCFGKFWNGEPIRLLGLRSSKLVHEDEPEQMSLCVMPIPYSSAGKDTHSTQKIHSILSTEHTSRSDKLRNRMSIWIRYEKSMAMML